ncbi:MAG: TetR/AcrR family transcriptional regulator [Oscillospiraceae bacterium]
MPPRAKYTREEIVQVALELVARQGIDALNARNLAAALGTSTRPLFTAFRNMGELADEVYLAAMTKFNEYTQRSTDIMPPFKSVGMQMVMFAAEQPKLFQLLFMSEREQSGSFEEMFERLGETGTVCREFIRSDYGLNEKETDILFKNVWIYTFGICSLVAKGICRYSEQEVSEMISLEFSAVMSLVLSGKAAEPPRYTDDYSREELFRQLMS